MRPHLTSVIGKLGRLASPGTTVDAWKVLEEPSGATDILS